MKEVIKYSYSKNDEYPEVLNMFLKYLSSNKRKSENTIKKYGCNLKQFLKYMSIKKKWSKEKSYKNLENIIINEITSEQIIQISLDDIEDYIDYCSSKMNNSESTLNNKISSLDTFYKYLVHKRIMKANPIEGIERLELPERVVDYLTLEESTKLLETINKSNNEFAVRDYCLMTLFLNIGARRSEMSNAKFSKLDLDNKKITLLGKGNKERVVKLNNACVNALNNYLKLRKEFIKKKGKQMIDSDALFISNQGKHLSGARIAFILKEYAELAGLDAEKIHLHELRHTSATLMHKYGKVDIRSIQKMLGHSNISTTQIYTHVDEEKLQEAVDNNPLANLG